jgi:hypothetical protein
MNPRPAQVIARASALLLEAESARDEFTRVALAVSTVMLAGMALGWAPAPTLKRKRRRRHAR